MPNRQHGALRATRLRIAAANDEPCCRCGKAIDYTLHGNSIWGPTLDHLTPIGLGGEEKTTLDMVAPAHRRCNIQHGAKVREYRKKERESKKNNVVELNPPAFSSGGADPALGGPRLFTQRDLTDELHSRYHLSIVSNADAFSPPRIQTKRPIECVGSLGDEWIDWVERNTHFVFRPWQRLVFNRALEIDAEGRFIWRTVVVSTPRQCGKGYLIMFIALARAHFAGRFSEPQIISHIANNLRAARRIHMLSWRWASQNGLQVKRAFGNEAVLFEDDSAWQIESESGIWGAWSSLILLDEAWNIQADTVESGIVPTMAERIEPQLWALSTSNRETTSLMPLMRQRAIDGGTRTLLMEWSAPYKSDVKDVEVWRAASPHWSKGRAELMASAVNTESFAEQWLNIWPGGDDVARSVEQWPPLWHELPAALDGSLRAGGVVAVESAHNRSTYGVAALQREPGGSYAVWSREVSSLEAVRDQIALWRPARVVLGASLQGQITGPFDVDAYAIRETRLGTALLDDACRRGRIAHNHDMRTIDETYGAAVIRNETGMWLSMSKSRVQNPALKAICWALFAAENAAANEVTPAIW
jgi:hypothetical protein